MGWDEIIWTTGYRRRRRIILFEPICKTFGFLGGSSSSLKKKEKVDLKLAEKMNRFS